MAEGILLQRLARSGECGVYVESAGTWAQAGVPATNDAVTVMAVRGIDITAHRSREVSAAMIDAADLVLVMTTGHLEALAAERSAVDEKLRLFSELGGTRYDILDPVGQGVATYRATADELDRLIDAGWAMIVGDGNL